MGNIKKKLIPSCQVFVRTFPRATTQSMDDYVRPSIKTQPEYSICHVRANDLIWNTSPNEIVRKTVDMAEKWGITLSEIILRTDIPDWNKKGYEVNTHLTVICKKNNIFLIDHGEKIKWNYISFF